MKIDNTNLEINFNSIPIDNYWCKTNDKELKMHSIHSYPAKFPFFIVSKAIEYSRNENVNICRIGDMFCGCGTTALESRKNNIPFWGTDINPVATLIAKVKSEQYNDNILNNYYKTIMNEYKSKSIKTNKYYMQHKRITYWFEEEQIYDLYKLIKIIEDNVSEGKYKNFFLCAFSNILKSTSKWLSKSIKPQIDPEKFIKNVIDVFSKQVKFMIKANIESQTLYESRSKVNIENKNFLKMKINNSFLDIVITSPPYVTSYEYADLHQLSLIWMGFTEDFRSLRKGSIGSVYNLGDGIKNIDIINNIGKKIYYNMYSADKSKSKSIAKYFIDISRTVSKTYSILNNGGLVFYIIGNTEYKGVCIDNARYITKCMIDTGFKNINVFKREISNKILPTYRDKTGKFTSNNKSKKSYSNEFIVIGRK